jgi:uncharacterized repeat protein (TIGR03803 family)
MRTSTVWLIVVLLGSILAVGQASEKVLWRFSGYPQDGAQPVDKLVSDSAGNFYGTTESGGNVTNIACTGCGTIFELSPGSNGAWRETILYNFCRDFDGSICLDGEAPLAGLIMDSAGNLYGTTGAGGGDLCGVGGGGCGTVFQLSPPKIKGDSWSYAVLYQFCQTDNGSCPDGAKPYGRLNIDTLGNLFGTTYYGGLQEHGTVFELSPNSNGWTESVLYSFCSEGKWPYCLDGWGPSAGVASDRLGNLYGTTAAGGDSKNEGGGVVYELSPISNGWKESVLHAFSIASGPKGGLLLGGVNFDAAGNLYSTAFEGGRSLDGVVFRLTSKNYTEQWLSFDETNGSSPAAGVFIDPRNGVLYGTTSSGGNGNNGTIYKVDGTHESVIYSFDGVNGGDGSDPEGALIADQESNLYGTTKTGGVMTSNCDTGCGTVFEISK